MCEQLRVGGSQVCDWTAAPLISQTPQHLSSAGRSFSEAARLQVTAASSTAPQRPLLIAASLIPAVLSDL